MKHMVLDILGVLFIHLITVTVLGGLAMFVWNMGAVSLLPFLAKLDFVTALAVMTGIYVIDLFIKSYVNKIISYKAQKNLSELLLREMEDEE